MNRPTCVWRRHGGVLKILGGRRIGGVWPAEDRVGSGVVFERYRDRGSWGRNKRWDYWAVLAGDLVVAITYADVDYLGMATIWWCDLATGETGGKPIDLPLARGVALPDRPGTEPLTYRGKGASVELVDDPEGTSITATWNERDGRPGRLDVRVDLPPGHESINVVIPWSGRQFQYTSKHQARLARGSLTVGDTHRTIGVDEGGDEAWGVLDVGAAGRTPLVGTGAAEPAGAPTE